MHRFALPLGCLMGAVAVLLGAFGAHALKSGVGAAGSLDETETARLLQTWEIGVRYQMYHAVTLLSLGGLTGRVGRRWLDGATLCFLTGTAVFSGLLYVLVLSGLKILGAIVPLGGLLLVAGWLILACGAIIDPRT